METPKVLIIGIGNLLWADEGFGVRAVEAMHRLYQWPENVRLMDGGTQGLYLVQHVREADILIVFDAVDYGLPPGTIKLVEGDEVPKFLGAKKISLHQTGFQEVLATAELLGGATQHLYLIGVQPVELDDFGGSLRDEMKARIGPAIQHAIDFLARFGISGYRRDVPLPETETLACEHMVMSRYEAQRPSAEDACRFGDPRVLMAERVHAGTADRQPPQTPGVG
ncbi:HyaD/HybD family hydrogenase maturation endopeptidase [Bradyrhizobium sp. AUGA SZCCT0283]|nr:HyaD/HybD family hydrogenase maturation endopeptidase [Bradyrhizobium sp. AUGA SZCCT0283]MBR1279740.1 HyaD/HybD family hydrogenase maturation endopeptidase [Bradyrhizobium sp. AUGA SZCCT0283]